MNLVMISVLDKKQLAQVSEEDFQRAVVAHAKGRGWKVHHATTPFTQKRDGSLRGTALEGWPDLFLTRGAAARAYELKAERGTASPAQRGWLAALEEAGITTAVFRPRDAAELIRELK